MSIEFRFEPRPKLKFDLKGITVQLRKAVEAEAFEHRRLLRETTKTWKGVKPQFRSTNIVSQKQIAIATFPFGGGPRAKGYWKWVWLERGTKIRWALMTGDWRSKTSRGVLGSGSGGGGVVIVGKRAMMRRNIKPRPGIQARNFIAEMNKVRSRKFKGELEKTFGIIAKNAITPESLRLP
jgi:hypothetical protein